MAEIVLVKEALTNEMIEAGARLVEKVDELGLPVPAAFWFFRPDDNDWRLMFVSPAVSALGPIEVYRKIFEARQALGADADKLLFLATSVLDTNTDLAKLVLHGFHTGPKLARIRFTRGAIDGHYIHDALIYRSAA